ncbi:MAG: hypothetical protein JNK48_21085 [Bryobacterales bacterium]|nr:hypothetical protein [Bryobacterales bacterium]
MAYRVMPIYNIDRAVGEGEANLPHDVKLVQAMIAALAARAKTPNAPPNPPTVDGKFTRDLQQWILAFQTHVASFGAALRPDGIVHPLPMSSSPGDWKSKFTSGYTSTIYVLNVFLRDANSEEHDKIGKRLHLKERPLFPKAS